MPSNSDAPIADKAPSPDDSDARGRRFDPTSLDAFRNLDETAARAPTWRGWVIGLLSVAALCKLVPVVDYVMRGTRLSLYMLPLSAIFLTFILVALYNLFLAFFKRSLGLTRQDVALVFCMTMVANYIPGHGFVAYFAAESTGAQHYATPENRWSEVLHPYMPEELTPHDPEDPNSAEPRPIEWLYTGLPPGQKIPWGAWLRPYAYWTLMILLLYGMMFAVCGLVRKQWADREKLAFPLAQVPVEMLEGVDGVEERGVGRSFFRNPLAWWGIGFVFLLHSWNALQDYYPGWPVLRLDYNNAGAKYLTELPWYRLNPVDIFIFPSVIGLIYLVSTEISFSIWFFYFVLKIAVLIAAVWGYGSRHEDFMYVFPPTGWRGMFINQGTGALLGLVLFGAWMARDHLKKSLRAAMFSAREDEEADEGLSARALWLVLLLGFGGSVAWLVYFQVGVAYAVLAVFLVLVLSTGMARLVSESGIFFMSAGTSPVEFTALAAPPAVMGVQTLVPLSMWSRMAPFGGLAPTIPILTSMQVGSLAGLKKRPLFLGIGVAVLMAVVLGFFGFFSTIYHAEGGGNSAGWILKVLPRREYSIIAKRTTAILHYEKKTTELAKEGRALPAKEIPPVARRDLTSIAWLTTGLGLALLFFFLRTRLFWWPHPIGYIMWSEQNALTLMWFSVLLGWAIKAVIVKYGGLSAFRKWRPFFLGMIIGGALAAIFWNGVAWYFNARVSYAMHL